MRPLLTLCIVVAICSVSIAGDITPTQKNTPVPTATQKTPVPQATQKTEIYSAPEPTQKTTPRSTPTQKNTPGAYQKGYETGTYSDVPIPQDLLDRLAKLQPQAGEPGKNLVRAIARRCVKKAIANFVQDNLPSLPRP